MRVTPDISILGVRMVQRWNLHVRIYIYYTFDGKILMYVCQETSVLCRIQKATNVDRSDK